MNGYTLSRQWFDFCFDNPEKILPTHTAMYMWIIEQWNRFGHAKKFGLPAMYSMQVLGIKSKNTYYKVFHDLVDFGFIQVVQKSKNQNTANIISISAVSNNKSADDSAGKSALDSALIQQLSQQLEHKQTSKPRNNKPIKILSLDEAEEIYSFYPKKRGKKKGIDKLLTFTTKSHPNLTKEIIINSISSYAKTVSEEKYLQMFSTWVNSESWQDELWEKQKTIDLSDKFIQDYGASKNEAKLLSTPHCNLSNQEVVEKEDLMQKYGIPHE